MLIRRVSALASCGGCGAAGGHEVARLDGVPTNSCLMLADADAARAWPRGDIHLRFCEGCGLIANRAFEPALTEYSERYEPSQAWSPAFRAYLQALAQRLAAAVPLGGREVLEIGCGQGEFLHLLCGLAGARGLGFDPCLDPRRGDAVTGQARNVELVPRFFDEAAAARSRADLLVCRMTLEHIPDADRFAGLCATVARNSAPGMRLFVQVPDSLRILRDAAFEDIYYEHCNYFTEASLRGLFARHGFRAEAVFRDYGDQYLALLARFEGVPRDDGQAEAVAEVAHLASAFAARYAASLTRWEAVMARAGRAVLWGSGSKGVAFLSALPAAARAVSHVVDINPHRQGMFMIGSGHPIIGPQALATIRPDTVILMNRVYRAEVGAMLAQVGLSPALHAL